MSRGSKPISLEIGDNGGTTEFVDPAAANNLGGGTDTDGTIRDANGTAFDASIHSHPDNRNGDGSFSRKRGRRSGSRNTGKSKAQIHGDIEKSAEMLTKGLMIFHLSLASITKTPELCLEEAEAKGLSESSLTLLSLYDIKPDPKVEAAILFAGQVGLVYGTRIVAIRARKSQEKAERRKGVAGVYDANGNAAGTTDYSFQEEFPQPGGSPIN